MIGKIKTRKIVDFAIGQSRADQTEVSLTNQNQALTRFANNYIHQNVAESDSSISIRVVFGRKIGTASTNSLELKKIKQTVAWAEKTAHFQKENKDFVSLPKVKRDSYRPVKTYTKRTSEYSDTERAQAVATIVEVARRNSLDSFGSVSNGFAELCIGNSLGVFAYSLAGDAFCNIVMAGKNSTGYAQSGRRDIRDIDFRQLAEIAARKALASANPDEIKPGKYVTIFEPLAVSDILSYMAYYAFNGKMFQEGRSFLTGKLGSKVVDERISIVDDSLSTTGFSFPFDFEGVPKRRIVLIDKGIARNVVYDSLTAFKEKKRSTGHALAAPNPFGPVPFNLVMRSGHQSLSEMISETERGILVTRFHYTNVIDPLRLTFTGMTRDGTFLIEQGKITKGIKNLRFTENIIDILNRVEALSKEQELVANDPGYGARFATGSVVPALKIRDFTFTSGTEF